MKSNSNKTYSFSTSEFEEMCKNPEKYTKKKWNEYLYVFEFLELQFLKECFKKYFPEYYCNFDNTILGFLFSRDYDLCNKFTNETENVRKIELINNHNF